MAKIEMTAKLRNVAGKGAAREIRNNKNIPAVIYGNKQDPVAIELEGHSFFELIKKPGLRTKLFVIDTGNNKEHTMLVDVQYHPVKDTPMHADFKRIDITKPVAVEVPVNLINVEISKGLKAGGALNFAVRNIMLMAMVDHIPEKVDIDLQNMNITDTFHGRDLKLPDGVELGLHQANLALVTITGKMKEEKEDAKGADATATAAADAASGSTGGAKPAAGDQKKTEPAKTGDAKK